MINPDSSPATTNDTGTISTSIVSPKSTQGQLGNHLRHIADVMAEVMDVIDQHFDDREAHHVE